MRWKTLNCISKFRENNTKAMVISKRLKFPKDETFSSPEPVVSWSRGRETRGYTGRLQIKPSGSGDENEDDRTDTNFIASIRIYFKRSKGTQNSLNFVLSMHFGENRRWVSLYLG